MLTTQNTQENTLVLHSKGTGQATNLELYSLWGGEIFHSLYSLITLSHCLFRLYIHFWDCNHESNYTTEKTPLSSRQDKSPVLILMGWWKETTPLPNHDVKNLPVPLHRLKIEGCSSAQSASPSGELYKMVLLLMIEVFNCSSPFIASFLPEVKGFKLSVPSL